MNLSPCKPICPISLHSKKAVRTDQMFQYPKIRKRGGGSHYFMELFTIFYFVLLFYLLKFPCISWTVIIFYFGTVSDPFLGHSLRQKFLPHSIIFFSSSLPVPFLTSSFTLSHTTLFSFLSASLTTSLTSILHSHMYLSISFTTQICYQSSAISNSKCNTEVTHMGRISC